MIGYLALILLTLAVLSGGLIALFAGRRLYTVWLGFATYFFISRILDLAIFRYSDIIRNWGGLVITILVVGVVVLFRERVGYENNSSGGDCICENYTNTKGEPAYKCKEDGCTNCKKVEKAGCNVSCQAGCCKCDDTYPPPPPPPSNTAPTCTQATGPATLCLDQWAQYTTQCSDAQNNQMNIGLNWSPIAVENWTAFAGCSGTSTCTGNIFADRANFTKGSQYYISSSAVEVGTSSMLACSDNPFCSSWPCSGYEYCGSSPLTVTVDDYPTHPINLSLREGNAALKLI